MDQEQVLALAESEIDRIDRMERQYPTHQSRKRGVQIDPDTDQTTPFEIWITAEPMAKKLFFATKEEIEAISDKLPNPQWQQLSGFKRAEGDWQEFNGRSAISPEAIALKSFVGVISNPPFSIN